MCRHQHLDPLHGQLQLPRVLGLAGRVPTSEFCKCCRLSGKFVYIQARSNTANQAGRHRLAEPVCTLQDRWLDPDAEYAATPNPYNPGAKSKRFFPFSQGSRNCVGRGLAHMNFTTTVAKLYSHFTFRLADEVIVNGFRCPHLKLGALGWTLSSYVLVPCHATDARHVLQRWPLLCLILCAT